ncbi:MAG: ABC transporter ATP-binding protein, partial [Candidatus Magasanikbacteria bacterium]|nr:ABC transporter ATP-binding protein [Candidatus Magasanikbacteria bacterium]
MSAAVLKINDLETEFDTRDGIVKAVDKVSYEVGQGETLGVVGESGCGKSVTSLSILRLIPNPPGRISGGEVLFKGEDLTKVSESRIREVRGNEISMIFQEPMTALNPVHNIGKQLKEVFTLKFPEMTKSEVIKASVEMLEKVG